MWRTQAAAGSTGLGRGRLVDEALPIALDALQMRVHQIHGVDRIAPGDRFEDAHMLGMRIRGSGRAAGNRPGGARGHQIEDADDAIEDIVLGGVDDLEMEIAILEIDRLARRDRASRCARGPSRMRSKFSSLARSQASLTAVISWMRAHLVRLTDLVGVSGTPTCAKKASASTLAASFDM